MTNQESNWNFSEREVDISEFMGQNIYIAFVHYDCSDEDRLAINYISVDFEGEAEETYTITATASAGGSINPSGAISVAEGDNQAFDIQADAGYYILDVEVDGSSVGAVEDYEFTNVDSNHTIHAIFEEITFTLTVHSDPAEGGTVIIDPLMAEYPHGTTVNLTPVPEEGYLFSHFEGDIDEYHTIQASAGPNGAIDPEGTVLVADSQSRTFNFIPDAGYQVANIFIDEDAPLPAAPSYTFNNVTENRTIHVTFEEGEEPEDPCIEDLPFSENFSTNVFAEGSPCWETAPVVGTLNWTVNAGTAYFMSAGNTEQTRMTTPPLNITDYSTVIMTFDHQMPESGGGAQAGSRPYNRLYVEYWNGTAWSVVGSFETRTPNITQRTVEFNSADHNFTGEYKIAFRTVGTNRTDTYTRVDNVNITGAAKSSTDKSAKDLTVPVIMDQNRTITAHFIADATPGDVNDDGFVNVLDVVWMVRYITGDIPEGFNEAAGDLNNDGDIDGSDLGLLIDMIFAGAKDETEEVNSEPANIYLDEDGIVSLDSDGTLLIVHFTLAGLNAEDVELTNLLQTSHNVTFNSETGIGLIYSMPNANIPAGKVDLFSITSGADLEGVDWSFAEGTNSAFDKVEINTYSAYAADDAEEEETVSIDDIIAEKFEATVFPNPNTGDFTVKISLQLATHIEMELLDERGRMISRSGRKSLSSGEHHISYTEGQNLNSGIYFLRINGFDSNNKPLGVIYEEKIIIVK